MKLSVAKIIVPDTTAHLQRSYDVTVLMGQSCISGTMVTYIILGRYYGCSVCMQECVCSTLQESLGVSCAFFESCCYTQVHTNSQSLCLCLVCLSDLLIFCCIIKDNCAIAIYIPHHYCVPPWLNCLQENTFHPSIPPICLSFSPSLSLSGKGGQKADRMYTLHLCVYDVILSWLRPGSWAADTT